VAEHLFCANIHFLLANIHFLLANIHFPPCFIHFGGELPGAVGEHPDRRGAGVTDEDLRRVWEEAEAQTRQ